MPAGLRRHAWPGKDGSVGTFEVTDGASSRLEVMSDREKARAETPGPMGQRRQVAERASEGVLPLVVDSVSARAAGPAWAPLGLGVTLALLAAWLVVDVDPRSSSSAAFGSGAILASAASMDSRPHLWICDREGDQLLGLDRDGFVELRLEVRSPVEVAPGPSGACWVLTALERFPKGRRGLVAVEAREFRLPARDVGPAWSLHGGPLGRGRFLAGSGQDTRLMETQLGSGPTALLECPGATRALQGEGLGLVLGNQDSWFFEEKDTGRAIRRDLRDEPGSLWAASREGWRCLRRGSEGWRFEDYSSRGEFLRSWRTRVFEQSGIRPVALLGAAGGGHWLVARGGEVFLLSNEGRRRWRRRLDLAPVLGAALDRDGVLWLLTPGGCLGLDEDGHVRPGQGGLEGAVDLARGSTTEVPFEARSAVSER